MMVEIERKFLLKTRDFLKGKKGEVMVQGYLVSEREKSIRIRVSGRKAFLTVKIGGKGFVRDEFEYSIPRADAEDMLGKGCIGPIIKKIRYRIKVKGKIWEIDEFLGENKGLYIAEIELESPDEEFVKPEWVGDEVTLDPKYLNANLVKNPYGKWE